MKNNFQFKQILALKSAVYHNYFSKETSVEELLSLDVFNLPQEYSYIQEKKIFVDSADFGNFYFLNESFKDLNKYGAFVYIGFSPRHELASFNIALARVKENNDTLNINIGVAINQFYQTIQRGSSSKILYNFLTGKFKDLVEFRTVYNTAYFYGLGFNHTSYSFENFLIYLNSKIYSKISFLTSDIGLLNYFDVRGSSLSNYLLEYNKIIQKKNIYINTATTHNNIDLSLSFVKHKNEFKKKKKIFLPTSSTFETSQILLNISGKLQYNKKIVMPYHSKMQNVQDWLFTFFLLQKELYFSGNQSITNIIKRTKNRRLALNKFFNLKNNFDNNLNNIINLFHHYYLNDNVYINQLNWNYFQKKIQIQKFFLMNSDIEVRNFFLTDSLSKNSSTMLKSSLFYARNRWNWDFK